MTLAENLKFYRTSIHFTREQVANRLDVTPEAVRQWETGVTYPRLDNIVSLAKVYGCKPTELLAPLDGEKLSDANVAKAQDLIQMIQEFILSMPLQDSTTCLYYRLWSLRMGLKDFIFRETIENNDNADIEDLRQAMCDFDEQFANALCENGLT